MATPTNRTEFKDWCKRKIGWPVIEINLSDEQIDDRVDEALHYYYDFHMDGTEKLYFKYPMYANNKPNVIHHLNIVAAGNAYSNSDTLVFTGPGTGANIALITNSSGSITGFNYSNNGVNYATTPTVTITTSTGSGANITAELGGYIPLPNTVIGVSNIFDIGTAVASSSDHLFNVRYQIALNEIWSLESLELAPYYMAMTQLRMIEEVLVGQQLIRYNRNRNRLYLDMKYDLLVDGGYVIVEAYEKIDPDKYPDIWADKWLGRYCAALIKLNWGEALSKFGGMPMPGGMTFNGQQIKQEAAQEVAMLQQELIETYSMPPQFYIG